MKIATEQELQSKSGFTVTIPPPALHTICFHIVGTAPYVQCKFSEKARNEMMATQEAGSTSKSRKKRVAKDFKAAYEGTMHLSRDGWHGIPAPAFRAAMIDACRLVDFKMTRAKLAVFIEPDGFDADDGTPLVKITSGEPRQHLGYVRLAVGVTDIRARAMWESWEADLRVTFDEGQFNLADVSNLLARAGLQVGIGEGRPNSKSSAGCGWGTFRILDKEKPA